MKAISKVAAASLPFLLLAGGCDSAPKNVKAHEALPACDDKGRLVLYTGQFAVDMARQQSVSLDEQGIVEGDADDAYTAAYHDRQDVSAVLTLHLPRGADIASADNVALAEGPSVGAADMRRILAAGASERVPDEGIHVTSAVSAEPVTPAATIRYGQMVISVYSPCLV